MPPLPDAALSALEIVIITDQSRKNDRARRQGACEMNDPVFNIQHTNESAAATYSASHLE
jgi:hypothetical protein